MYWPVDRRCRMFRHSFRLRWRNNGAKWNPEFRNSGFRNLSCHRVQGGSFEICKKKVTFGSEPCHQPLDYHLHIMQIHYNDQWNCRYFSQERESHLSARRWKRDPLNLKGLSLTCFLWADNVMFRPLSGKLHKMIIETNGRRTAPIFFGKENWWPTYRSSVPHVSVWLGKVLCNLSYGPS